MKKITLILFLSLITCSVFPSERLDSLLLVLDNAIEEHNIYSDEREMRIKNLKQMAGNSTNKDELYNFNLMLYKEYKAYKCDSAIHYLHQNISLATQQNNLYRINESKLLLTRLLASTGMYMEATDILSSINRSSLSDELLIDYFSAYNYVFSEASFYTQDNTRTQEYRYKSNTYQDSIFMFADKQSELYLHLQESDLLYSGKTDEAFSINDTRLATTTLGTPEFAMIAFHRSLIYHRLNDTDNEKIYLALSSLSDIRSAIKDHASLWMLAQILYKEGDIERAYQYIRFSWNETVFYNARLRSIQSAGILSLIDKTYHALVKQQNSKLQNYLLLTSTLGLLLVIALLYIYRQMRKLAAARNDLQQINNQLKDLNEELKGLNKEQKEMNNCLTSTNMELSESNRIKEEYIGRFIKLCSMYIDKLDAYRRMVNKKITTGKTEELYKITRSQEALEDELKELYIHFDTAFLQLFPNFVDEFNNLLEKEERIHLKKGELLNTELRIFALIRLGIDDSSQIAEFLRYSVNTIYNYRAKVKNKACVSREDFEVLVMRIK
ncbi:DUF6377 domain-containing protein [Bacteroides sp. 519]|uniref:DUF6377 domain-containing protein n=1 Tax=Bacteroides sp. 519 TaxID=2302937 RepID=UPI0013D6A2D6|nr:DUF6377 domain-containing protein [Bacteroides sp. 519]NDV58046.1 transcriptional regulator [Bacteroides sp. 519]